MDRGFMQCGCTIIVDDDDDFVDWDEYCDMHSSHMCMDCEKHETEFNEYYMVHSHIWESITVNNEVYGLLCIGCLEDRLGRELRPNDFTGYPVNSRKNAQRRSWRQRMRMGYL